MKKALLFVLLLLPIASYAASFSIAITNDNKTTTYFTGRPGPWLFKIRNLDADTTVTCNGAPCPDQINEDQTIIFTVNSTTKKEDFGFNIDFTSRAFVMADDICFHTENYFITSGKNPGADNKMIISEEPPKGGTRDGSSDCAPYVKKHHN